MRTWRALAALAGLSILLTPSLASAQSEPVTLTVLDHQAPRIAAMAQIVPMCEQQLAAQGMNVKINVQDAGSTNDTEFKTKVTTGYQGDSPPDVISYPGTWVPDFAAAGYLADLTDRLGGWADWNDHFYQVLKDRTKQADGKWYSMPRHGTVMEFFVRKDALDAAGVSTTQPASWAELIARAEDWYTKTGLPAITLPAGKSWGGGTFDEGFINVFLGSGGKLYDDATSKWIVRSPALTDTFTFYSDLASKNLLPTQALLGANPWEPTKYDGFTGTKKDGTTVPVAPPITTQGSWGWVYDWGPKPNGARPIPNLQDKVITWAFPGKAPGDTYVWGATDWEWTISAKSKHPDEAFAFLKCVNAGQPLAIDIAAVGNVAPRDDIQSVEPYASMPYLIAMEKLLPTGRTFKAQVGLDKIQAAVGDATEAILLGQADGPAAAELFATDASDLLGPDAVEDAPAQ